MEELKNSKLPLSPQAVPSVNQVIHLSAYSILGDKRLPCSANYQDMDLQKMRHTLAQGNFNNLANTGQICGVCFQHYCNIDEHLNQGSFGANHEFDRLPKHLNTSLLLATTLQRTQNGFISRYKEDFQEIYTPTTKSITLQQIRSLRQTGKYVPLTLAGALESTVPLYNCGEHNKVFKTSASLTFHLITTKHAEDGFLCTICKEIVPSGGLKHLISEHNLEFPPAATIPNLYQLGQICSNARGDDILEEFNHYQLVAMDRHASTEPLYMSVQKLTETLPAKNKAAYKRINHIFHDLPAAYELGLTYDTWDSLILQTLSLTIKTSDLAIIHKLISRLPHNLQAPADVSTTIRTLSYETTMTILSNNINFLFRGSEKISDPDNFKVGEDKPLGLQPTTGHPLARTPHRLLDNHDLNFHAYTLGTKIFYRSGIHVQEAVRVLNLTPDLHLLHSTAAYEGLVLFPDDKGNLIQVPAEDSIINTIKSIMEIPNRKTAILLEFNISPNLKYIPPEKWTSYIHREIEDYATFFFCYIRSMYMQTACCHPIIVMGQAPLYHPKISLKRATRLADYITRILLNVSAMTRIPFLPTPGLVGFTGQISVPLTTAPRGPVFAENGELSHYSVQQAVRAIQTAVTAAQLLEDIELPPGFRHHMVTITTLN